MYVYLVLYACVYVCIYWLYVISRLNTNLYIRHVQYKSSQFTTMFNISNIKTDHISKNRHHVNVWIRKFHGRGCGSCSFNPKKLCDIFKPQSHRACNQVTTKHRISSVASFILDQMSFVTPLLDVPGRGGCPVNPVGSLTIIFKSIAINLNISQFTPFINYWLIYCQEQRYGLIWSNYQMTTNSSYYPKLPSYLNPQFIQLYE